ncbi:MAG: enoyl-CoA hydratase [Leptospirales bacterium]|jgi:enoyl-CoA hydratase
MNSQILTENDGPIGRVIFNNPEKRNAFNLAMWRALPEALAELNDREEIRAIILQGAGDQAFVAGADISEFEALRKDPAAAREYNAVTNRAFRAVAESPAPTIARIRGFCFGGGCAIALNSDLRIASADARFCIPAAKLGLGYGYENVRRLADELGPAAAREMLFTARVYAADEALRIGLIHQLVEAPGELDERAADYAELVARNAPLTVRSAKIALNEYTRGPAADVQKADGAMDVCYESEDYREGVSAFLEKRKAAFRGR